MLNLMKYIYIKRIFFAVLSILLLQMDAVAQEDNRTLPTRIADLLAQIPAADSSQFARLMNETAALGEAGILEMARMFTPPGEGDNSRLEYALGGLPFYAMQPKKEDVRLATSNAYTKALNMVQNDEVKGFFIRQLQIVGKEEAVASLEKLLSNSRLCDPAARALVQINTPSAQQALLKALSSAKDNCRYSLVEALGDTRNKNAVNELTQLAGSNDKSLQKLVLNALANIGDPSSGSLLAGEAEKAGYTLDETNATASYLLWAKRMAEAGNKDKVEQIAERMVNQLDQEKQVHTRTAALKLLADTKGEAAMPALLAAANDKNPAYRAAALKYAADFTGEPLTAQWLKQLKKASPEAKAGIINMLGDRNDPGAYAAVAKSLNSKEPAVKMAAISAAAKLGQESSLPKLLQMIKTTDKAETDVIKRSLLTMQGENVVAQVAAALPKTSSYGKAALLEVLGARKAAAHSDQVLALASVQDPVVKLAALNALGNIASQNHLPLLYPLLLSANTEDEESSAQAAIINVLSVADKSHSTDMIMEQMRTSPADKKHRYYAVLASIGSKKALEAVITEFRKGDDVAKKAAIKALSNWENFSAGRELLKIAQSSPESPYFNQALTGYIQQVRSSSNTPENKYLFLREAMVIAKTADQKKKIMQEIGRSRTLPALLYAGTFLDDKEVQQQAVHAVMNIALSNEGFYGEKVRELLNKTHDLLQGQESAYMKASLRKHLSELPEGPGFVPLFNGRDLTGWKGLVDNPIERAKMDRKTLVQKQKAADEKMRQGWKVENGELIFTGHGDNIATEKLYGDFEMFVDWKIYDDGHKEGDAGIYLRGTPQVQIWDTSRVNVGAQVGSGGLYNNKTNPSKPLKVADNFLDEWNSFHITMLGDRVTVYLNGELVTDNVILENYWDRGLPIFPEEQIELQAHGSRVAYRDIYIREIPRAKPFELSAAEKKEGFKVLFDGTNMHHWQGNTTDYTIEDGNMVVRPKDGSHGNLFTKEQFNDFVFRFEFQLTPGANNGLGIRAPLEGDAAYTGMELQILDNEAEIYKNLEAYQYHGSVYGIIPAKRGFLKPTGEWNYQEVIVKGPNVKVILNGQVILDGDLVEATKNGTLDGKDHPGLKRSTGHIGFLGHGSEVKFRNIRIKDLSNKGKELKKSRYQ
jgi:HEAT repeat protein